MKKNFFLGFIALAALTVSSCSNDADLTLKTPDNAIEFGTYVGRDAQTRGVVLNDANLLDFGVYAFYTSGAKWTDVATPNFMYNQKVERTSTSDPWTYSPKKYWPTKNTFEYISFFAFAPFYDGNNGIAVESANTATGTPTLTYTINTGKLDKLADFTADVIMDESKGLAGANPDNSNQTVTFDFKHELTRLGITAKLDRDAFDGTDDNKTKVNIKQIDFTGTGFATEATYKFANVSNAKGAWTYTAAASPLNVVAGATGSVLVSNNDPSSWISEYTQKGFLLEDDDPELIFGANNYLFLIPPTADGTGANNKVNMRIHYDIVTNDTKLSNNHSVSSAVKEIEVPAGLLKQGKAYNFVLTFNLNEIVFTASVVDWETPIDSDSNVDWPDSDI